MHWGGKSRDKSSFKSIFSHCGSLISWQKNIFVDCWKLFVTCVLISQSESEIIGFWARVDQVGHGERSGEGGAESLGVEDQRVVEEPEHEHHDDHENDTDTDDHENYWLYWYWWSWKWYWYWWSWELLIRMILMIIKMILTLMIMRMILTLMIMRMILTLMIMKIILILMIMRMILIMMIMRMIYWWSWEWYWYWWSWEWYWWWWWSRLTWSWCWGSPSASDQPGPREDDSDQREQHCWCSPDTEQQKYFIFNKENIWSYRLIILIIQILTLASNNLQWIFLVKQFARWSNVSLSQLYRAPLGELLRRWHRQIIF